jgi:hypothetical protein
MNVCYECDVWYYDEEEGNPKRRRKRSDATRSE